MEQATYQIITFYEFKKLRNLEQIKSALRSAMQKNSVLGTIIIADEGFNSTVSGRPADIEEFVRQAETALDTRLSYKSSFHTTTPFRRAYVKIKPEIVTFKQKVDIEKGAGTHVPPTEWNRIVREGDVLVLDTRNEYECEAGSFRGAVNPRTRTFSQLAAFVDEHLNPEEHRKVAVYCTGGIRCEKFVPFLKEKGFSEVYQLDGGILKYLEEVPAEESLWEGECFVFDQRVAVDQELRAAAAAGDSSENKKN